MKMKTFLLFLCIAGCCLWCCSRIQSYSEIPEIHFKSLSFDSITSDLETDLKAILLFSFIDGDGDLGVRPEDMDDISQIYYTWLQKMPNQEYQHYLFSDTVTTVSSSVIPYSEVMNKSDAQNKVLKGTIQIELFPPRNPQDVDTMCIRFYITDRANHSSNIEQTPDFSILNFSVSEK